MAGNVQEIPEKHSGIPVGVSKWGEGLWEISHTPGGMKHVFIQASIEVKVIYEGFVMDFLCGYLIWS